MPAPKRAKRGKHRWVGLEINQVFSRVDLKNNIESLIKNSNVRIFDVKDNGNRTRAILKVPLSNYRFVLECLNQNEEMSTITSSGKIRLVRQRISNF
ncbi:MAG: hypothetical protein CMB67_04230 [Euryarchaeota archaeon]|nr:hypothetical protein [Euryarchaeota archaeon]|tara:strand:+ start:1097 stop:1387 length:291 start_codon:yes stop_codon:yes gene_type:complete